MPQSLRPIIILIITTVALAPVFIMFPHIDLWMSGQFYNVGKGGFWLKDNPILLVLYYLAGKPGKYTLIALLAALLGYNLLTGKKFIFDRKALSFLVMAALLGPVLITGAFKETFHRARPVQTVDFGGEKPFTPAFEISHYCAGECKSFVSGHTSMGFFLVAFALVIADARKRKKAYICLFLLGIAIALARIMQGAHYLSDVTFGGLFTLISTHTLYYCIYRKAKAS